MISGRCTPVAHSEPCRRVAFDAHMLSCSLALASVELTRDFCEQLDKLVGPQLTLLASDICEQFTINRRISGSVQPLTPLLVIALVASISASTNDRRSFHLVHSLETCEPKC